MTMHSVRMTAEAVELLNYIADAAEGFAEWMDQQHEKRHELDPVQQCKLDDVMVLASSLVEFEREYRDPPQGIVIMRRFAGSAKVYWDGNNWTDNVRKARFYDSFSAAKGVVTKKKNQYVEQHCKGKPGTHHLNQWANAWPVTL